MRTLLLAATAWAMLGGAAYAESISTSGLNTSGASSSNSAAKAVANTRSAAHSVAVGNSTTINMSGSGTSGSGTADPATTTGSDQYIGYGGGYTVRNTPEVIPPSVVGGNACAVGASAGVSVAGFGIAGGATWADRACERRQQAALLFNMGEQKVALELMCQDDYVRSAMKLGGKPCSTDAALAQASASLAQVPPPEMQVAAPPTAAAASVPAAPRPEWCSRARPTTEPSKAYVAQECGG